MDDFMKALEMELLEPPENLPAERPEQEFHIKTQEQAEWVVSKFNAIDAAVELVQKQAAEMVKEREAQKKYLEFRFGSELKAWAKQNLPAGKKSLKLLTGTLVFRSLPEKLEVTNEADCLSWAKEHAENCYKVKVEEKIDKIALNKHYKETGEIPDGCDLIPESESFKVE